MGSEVTPVFSCLAYCSYLEKVGVITQGGVTLLTLLDAQLLYDLVKFPDDLLGYTCLHRGEVLG